MSGGAGLERAYRRLLACYPRRFRDEQGEELLGVLLASARDGQQRPGLLESADLVRNGLGMRLHPDVSRSARQGWSDALAAYSLAGPVLLFLSTIVNSAWIWLFLNSRPHLAPMFLFWPGAVVTLATAAVIIALVTAGWRKTALTALVPAGALLWIGWIPENAANIMAGLSVYLLVAVALITSPGSRYGRRLVHWGHWAYLLLATAATAAFLYTPFHGWDSLADLGVLAVLIFAFNKLGRALRLSRYFRLLIAATFYPIIFVATAMHVGGPQSLSNVGVPGLLALLFAGPLLCAVVALSTIIRPRRRRII